ncbi:hypothetical protein [Desulfonatronum lacustre]|uniref:hypothetical protein n=1 Tax=Desulfonatronum lacustre TaxID=66849 RepID=UPI000490ABB0|nr:hypothetical protein [Desulfonatronum lacustre]
MRKFSLTAFLALALLFVASSPSHAASHAPSGTYIDCIHGCPDLIVCSNCCNAVFSDVLTTCDANRDRCEALCPPGAVDCLNNCMRDRNDCLGQGSRDFVCPQWQEGVPQAGLTKSTDPTCAYCHEDDR